jgi:poly(ADP-ribose) glycohydrolase ARH3
MPNAAHVSAMLLLEARCRRYAGRGSMAHDNEAPVPSRRRRGALLGCCVGDAFGRPFAGSSRADSRLAPLLGGRARSVDPWDYSDDTQMMISVAESFLRCGRVDALDLLDKLVANYEPARGYGKGMKRICEALLAGARHDQIAGSDWAEGSRGDGAAVRVAPLACAIHDEDELATAAQASARVTHAHPLAVGGCVLMALAVQKALRHPGLAGWNPLEFVAELRQSPHLDKVYASKLDDVLLLLRAGAEPAPAATALGSGVTAEESVPYALFAFTRCAPSFEDVTLAACLAGGDTDTIAAMSCTLAGALLGDDAIPAQWQSNLVAGRKGRDYVLSLAERLGGQAGTRPA